MNEELTWCMIGMRVGGQLRQRSSCVIGIAVNFSISYHDACYGDHSFRQKGWDLFAKLEHDPKGLGHTREVGDF